MTARELIKCLECCDLDKEVKIIISVTNESEDSYQLLLRNIQDIVEHKELITLN